MHIYLITNLSNKIVPNFQLPIINFQSIFNALIFNLEIKIFSHWQLIRN